MSPLSPAPLLSCALATACMHPPMHYPNACADMDIAFEQVHEHELLRKAVALLVHRGQAFGYRGLHEAYLEQKAKRRRSSLAVAEWRQNGTRKPWYKWRAVSFCRSVADASMRRLALRGLSFAIRAWVDHTSETRRREHIKRSGLATMLDRRLRFGMGEWMEYAQTRSDGFRKLRLGASAFMYGLMRAFWNSCEWRRMRARRQTQSRAQAEAPMAYSALLIPC